VADPQLALWFDGVHTATITDHGFGTISLQYTPEAQNSSALLSTKLPIREAP
jgi:serine/threonine-protein kinase HipA